MLNSWKKSLLLVGDILLLYGALVLTLFVRYRTWPDSNIWTQHWQSFTLLFMVWVVVLYVNGLYDLAASKNDVEFYNRLLRNLLINFGLAAAYFYLLTDRLFDIKPRAVFFLYIGIHSILFVVWRYWYNSLVQSPNFLKNVLVIGLKDEARELVREILHKPQLGYRITAIIHNRQATAEPDLPGVAIYNSGENLKHILREHKISTVVTALNPHSNPQLVQNLYESLSMRLQYFDLPDFYEKLTGKVPVTTIGHIWFLENLAEGDRGGYETLKRVSDVFLALLGLSLSIPLFPIIALLVKMDSSGPLLFRQTRVGYLSRPFVAMKFRSMVIGAEADGQPQWASFNDPRVTRVGRFLRRTRLDEIPQLWNVLRGEMSFIGPRPERPEFVKNLQTLIPFYNERHLIKPGLTGWAQINFRYGSTTGDALKKLQYDLFYIKNRSLPLDIGILLKTINIILSGLGQ